MSTKIYNGMRAVDRNPFRVQSRIKETLEPIFLAKFDDALKKAVSETGKRWDEVFPALFPNSAPEHARWEQAIPEPASRFEIADTLYTLIVALQQTATHTFSDLDFGYEVLLLPNGRGVSDRPLVLLFSERGGEEYRKALVDANVAEEYGYWDNSDKPDGVTDAAWAERRRAWSKLEVPRSDGLSIAMPSRFDSAWRVRA